MKTLEQLADEGELFYNMESELVKQQLFAKIKEASIERRVGRELVDVMSMKAGTTLDIILADKDSMEFRRVAEGAYIPVDVEAYTKLQITPNKHGNSFVFSQEIREDANWDVVARNLRQAGREAGVYEDSLIFTAFADATYGFVSESGHDYTSAGTEISIADIAGMMLEIEENDYEPDKFVLHPEQVSELRQIDTFVEADKLGSREMHQTGFVGRIFGMDTLRTTGTSASYGYMLDSREAAALVIRRPMTMKTKEIVERDCYGVYLTMRMAAKVVRPKAGVRITVS